MALAQDLQVQREHQGAAVRGLGAVDQALDEALVLHHVQLEPEALSGMLGHIFDGADAHGREGERYPELARCAGGQDLAVGVLHAGQSGRGQCHRHGDRLADHGAGGAAVFHVHGHALAELDLVEVAFVVAVGALGPGAAVGIVVKHARDTFLGQTAQIFNMGNDGHDGGSCGGMDCASHGSRRSGRMD